MKAMPHLFAAALLLILGISACQAQEPTQGPLSPGAALLFKDVKTTLTPAEKEQVFQGTGFIVAADSTQFALPGEAAQYPFSVSVNPLDLNGDGVEEIALSYGNLYTSGNTGASFMLFMRSPDGRYGKPVGNIGFLYVLTETANGYPDLMVTGMGDEYPVLRWNGQSYEMHRRMTVADWNDRDVLWPVGELSRRYLEGQ